MLPTKTCSKCDRELPLCEFGRTGAQRWCRECKTEWMRLRREGIRWWATSKAYANGKIVEVRSPYEEWTKWAVNILTEAARKEVKKNAY